MTLWRCVRRGELTPYSTPFNRKRTLFKRGDVMSLGVPRPAGRPAKQVESMTPNDSAIAYIRVSSLEQTQGKSLETQEESCRHYCAARSYPVLGVFRDAHTGTELDRPGLNAAVAACAELRPAVVVLHDVDRLARDTAVHLFAEREFTRHGARIEYVLGGGSAEGSASSASGAARMGASPPAKCSSPLAPPTATATSAARAPAAWSHTPRKRPRHRRRAGASGRRTGERRR
jgi:hypothetical protein